MPSTPVIGLPCGYLEADMTKRTVRFHKRADRMNADMVGTIFISSVLLLVLLASFTAKVFL